MSTKRSSKKRFQKTGKRVEAKDRRVPRKKEYGTSARTKKQHGKGGGKFTWGNALDYYDDLETDPEFAEEREFEQAVEEAYDEFATSTEQFYQDLVLFKKFVKPVIADFFEHGDFRDLMDEVAEYDDPRFNYELVKRLMTMSLDRKNREKELVSQLLVVMHTHHFVRSEDIADGFVGVFEQLSELTLDCPNASRIIAKFLARAIADECLAPRYLDRGAFIESGGKAVEEARTLLSMKHGTARMERVWGAGAFEVRELKKAIVDLVKEYLISEDLAEAAQCVRDLEARNFHHEVVKKIVELSMDFSAAKQQRAATLLQTLYNEEVVHPTQFVIGFKRLFQCLPNLRCDVPAADAILNGFVDHGKRSGYLPERYVAPTWLEGQTSEEDEDDAHANVVPLGFTAEMAEEMQEFQVLSPGFDARIANSLVPHDVVAAAQAVGIDSDEDSSEDDEDIARDYEIVHQQEVEAEMDEITDFIATKGLNLLQTGLN